MNTQKIQSVHDFLSLLKGVKPASKNQWLALCPRHHDTEQSLSVKEADGKILIKCFAGCATLDIVASMGLAMAELNLNGSKGIGEDATVGKACYSVTPSPKSGNLATNTGKGTVTPPALQSVTGVTVSSLAEAKHLPIDHLKGLGISDFTYHQQSAVRIPYYNETGAEVAIRFRLALTAEFGDRFKWRKGDHAMPYGLNRLDRKAGWVLVVEGESDCWTCWLHGIPAIGAPGKSTWPSEWGEYLKGLEVYVWQEPEAEDFTLRLLVSAADLRYIRAPDGIKDISEAHIQGHDVPRLLGELKAKAESGQVLKAQYDNEQLAQLYIKAKAVIEAKDPLELVKDTIRGLGYGGDITPAIITYLAVTSRLLAMRSGAMPVHLLLTGPSSSGKSYTLTVIKKLLPDEAHYTVDAGSPRIIIYNDAPLEHRVLIFGESDNLPAGEDSAPASAIRNLLQDHYLHYEVTVHDPDTGDYTMRKVDKPGPTVLITTSVRPLGAQLTTRLFTLEIDDSKEQIGAALETQAALETEGSQPLDDTLVAFQSYLQLKAPLKVVVPFAGELARIMSKMASTPRILRDFTRLLSLIKSVAIIRHHWRQTDNEGRMAATLADYETVRELVNDMYIDSSVGTTSETRKLVEAVVELDASRQDGERITATKLACMLDTSKMAVSRRAKKALRQDWLVNRELRKGYPADYVPGEPMPETEGLPTLEDLGSNTVTDYNTPHVTASSFNNGDCNTVTPFTDGDTPPPPSSDIPDYPTSPCQCGCGDYWLTDWNEWFCSRCHPKPGGES